MKLKDQSLKLKDQSLKRLKPTACKTAFSLCSLSSDSRTPDFRTILFFQLEHQYITGR